MSVGALAAALALIAQDGARRRGDARVLLVSLTFPPGPRSSSAGAGQLQQAVVVSIAVWIAWTLAALPPLNEPHSEGAPALVLRLMAVVGTVAYGVAAIRFWRVFRDRMTFLPAGLIACFVLLMEAMLGVATTGERAWHASWWLWHALIVVAYCLVGFAAGRQWRDERFRPLYLETTRQRRREVSVLFSDLAGYTAFTERSRPDEVAEMLEDLHGTAMPLASRRFGGVVEALTGDGMYVSFNAHHDQPDHAERAAAAALALQDAIERRAAERPGWPRLRIRVNTS